MNRVEKYNEVLREIENDPAFTELLKQLKEIQATQNDGQERKEAFKLPFSSEPEYKGHIWR